MFRTGREYQKRVDGEEGRDLVALAEIPLGALSVEFAIGCFGGECPGGLVACAGSEYIPRHMV